MYFYIAYALTYYISRNFTQIRRRYIKVCHGRLLVDRCQSASARPYTPCSHTVGQAHYRMATSSGDRKRSAMSLDMNQMFLTEHNNNSLHAILCTDMSRSPSTLEGWPFCIAISMDKNACRLLLFTVKTFNSYPRS